MTQEEFKKAMSKMESLLTLNDDQRQNRQLRWKETFKRLERFTMEEFEAAADALVDDHTFLPAYSEILAACEEARKDLRPKREAEKSAFTPAKHTCSEVKPTPTPYLGYFASLAPYEIKHLCCPGEIPATCPNCGVGHLNTSILKGIADLDKQAVNWNFHWKGMLLCDVCSEAEKNNGR